MKTIKYNLFFATIGSIVTLFTSCNNYLEVKPKGFIIPEKIEDYDGLLFSQQMTLSYPPELLYATDDCEESYDLENISTNANAYFWRSGLDPTELVAPAIWGTYYAVIYHCNVIINQASSASNGTTIQKEQLIAEAKVNRASAYFHLLTAFSKAYDPQTASSLPGVPLVTSTNVTDAIPPRASLQEVVDLIIADTESAIGHLPSINKNGYRVNKKAANGLLSRVHLYLGNYEKALAFADKVLAEQHQLVDYNTYSDVYEFPEPEVSPENVWMQGASDYTVPLFMYYSNNLKALFSGDDLRLYLFSESGPGDQLFYNPPMGRFNFGITYPELYLIKAEVLARAKRTQEALDLVNTLRKHRIETTAYTDFATTDADQALTWVLEERQRELAFRGVRWMDMKRLDHEKRMPLLQRLDTKTGKVMATLAPGSKQYTFQIPARVRQFNKNIVLNEE